jgi:hypothetical protein
VEKRYKLIEIISNDLLSKSEIERSYYNSRLPYRVNRDFLYDNPTLKGFLLTSEPKKTEYLVAQYVKYYYGIDDKDIIDQIYLTYAYDINIKVEEWQQNELVGKK